MWAKGFISITVNISCWTCRNRNASDYLFEYERVGSIFPRKFMPYISRNYPHLVHLHACSLSFWCLFIRGCLSVCNAIHAVGVRGGRVVRRTLGEGSS